MMRDFLYKHRRTVFWGMIVGLLLIVGISVFFIVKDRIYSARVDILVTPSIAKVKIDDHEYSTMGEYKIKPGEYEVEVSADGFVSKKEKIVAIKDEITNVQVFLDPVESNADWYNEHPGDGLILGEIQSNIAAQAVQALKEKNPILNELPLEIDYYTPNLAGRVHYTISYQLNDENNGFSVLVIDYSGGNYDNAILRLENLGFDMSRYEIEYIDESEEDDWGYAG